MTDNQPSEAGYVWRPSRHDLQRANLTAFMSAHGLDSFDALHRRSIEDVPWFTEALLDYLGLEFHQPYDSVLDLSQGMAWPQWCVGGRMNIVTNCLDKHLGTPQAEQTALVWQGEEGSRVRLTYAELAAEVNKAANGLRALGLDQGDAVGLYMPLTPEEVVALLATVKIGGIVLPLFSGYGAAAVASRLEDGRAKLLFTADGYFRNGSLVSMKPTADEAARRVAGLEHMIVLRRAGNDIGMTAGRDQWWDEWLAGQPAQAEAADTGADDPLMIIYTSGTTGKPKGAVHTHCGFPVKAAQDMAFGMDVHPGELIYWITDMGWMMGPWLVFGSLLLRASMFLYDGSPTHPEPDRVWRMIAEHGVNQLGLSPTFIRALIPYGREIVDRHDLSSLKLVGSTGEAWNPDPWHWLFEVVCDKSKPIINYSGGTELSGGIVMGNPVMPLKPTALAAPCPGIAADVLGPDGESLIGQVGELVIKTPWIGMTRGFWQDPERYLATYWSRWPDVWVHGDWALVDDDGSWFILGRSDDTLKVGGKRLGPAEVESILVSHPNVVEAAAIGVPDKLKGTALVAFCVLQADEAERDEIRVTLSRWLIDELGKPLAPRALIFLDDLPKTRNAKLMRRMLRAAYLGEDPGDTSALVNPEVLEQVKAKRA
ncbi:MAG TPA: AMP-binding protein [Anaerolineales bacterium]|jgi:acetyl-CoA synthetase